MIKNKSSAAVLEKCLRKLGNPARAKGCLSFFKTGPGQYGEGDIFLGVTVPQLRATIQDFEMELPEIKKALHSPLHEVRLGGLLLLVKKFQKAGAAERKKIFHFYIAHSKRINNWDLVDSSAHLIAGKHLETGNRSVLYRFAKSRNLWQRRIAIVSTWHEIRRGRFSETLKISEMLLSDDHDLIHKACGWMLREADKKTPGCIDRFLKKHHGRMPRTMLRYAIERFPQARRKKILAGKI